MSGRARFAVALALLLPSLSAAADDPIGSLITGEQSAYEQWLESADEPPAAYLNGDARSVELLSPGSDEDDTAHIICAALDLPNLIEASGGDPARPENVLNFNLPRVREIFGDACLMRPGDRVVAAGPFGTEERTVKDLVIRKEKAPCPNDAPYALVGRLDQPLPAQPYFLTSNTDIAISSTTVVPVTAMEKAELPLSLRMQLPRLVQFTDDFRVDAWRLPMTASGTAIVLTRIQPGTDDDGLPAVLLAVSDGERIESVWTERVDLAHGSGRFSLEATMDHDGDGSPEIVISGVHRGCPYTAVFTGDGVNWSPLPLPIPPCGC